MSEVAEIIMEPFKDPKELEEFKEASPKAKEIAEKMEKLAKEITGK